VEYDQQITIHRTHVMLAICFLGYKQRVGLKLAPICWGFSKHQNAVFSLYNF